MIPYLHNAIFSVNVFLDSVVSFWIMRSQRSRRRDIGLLLGSRLAWYFAAGLFQRWRTKYWPKPAVCVSDDGPKELGLYHMQGAFYILFVLVMLSLLILAIECVFSSVSRMKTKQQGLIRQAEDIKA